MAFFSSAQSVQRDGFAALLCVPRCELFRLVVDGDLQDEGGWKSWERTEPGSLKTCFDALAFSLFFLDQSLSVDLILTVQRICSSHFYVMKRQGQTCVSSYLRTAIPGCFRSSLVQYDVSARMVTESGLVEFFKFLLQGSYRQYMQTQPYFEHLEYSGDLSYLPIDCPNGKRITINQQYLENIIQSAATDEEKNQLLATEAQRVIDSIAKKNATYNAPPISEPYFYEECVNALVTEFNTARVNFRTVDEKIAAIAKCMQLLERLHPFADCNGRTFECVILNYLLMQEPFSLPPTMFSYPGKMDFHSITEIVQLIKDGNEKVGSLINGNSRLFNFDSASLSAQDLADNDQNTQDLVNTLKQLSGQCGCSALLNMQHLVDQCSQLIAALLPADSDYMQWCELRSIRLLVQTPFVNQPVFSHGDSALTNLYRGVNNTQTNVILLDLIYNIRAMCVYNNDSQDVSMRGIVDSDRENCFKLIDQIAGLTGREIIIERHLDMIALQCSLKNSATNQQAISVLKDLLMQQCGLTEMGNMLQLPLREPKKLQEGLERLLSLFMAYNAVWQWKKKCNHEYRDKLLSFEYRVTDNKQLALIIIVLKNNCSVAVNRIKNYFANHGCSCSNVTIPPLNRPGIFFTVEDPEQLKASLNSNEANFLLPDLVNQYLLGEIQGEERSLVYQENYGLVEVLNYFWETLAIHTCKLKKFVTAIAKLLPDGTALTQAFNNFVHFACDKLLNIQTYPVSNEPVPKLGSVSDSESDSDSELDPKLINDFTELKTVQRHLTDCYKLLEEVNSHYMGKPQEFSHPESAMLQSGITRFDELKDIFYLNITSRLSSAGFFRLPSPGGNVSDFPYDDFLYCYLSKLLELREPLHASFSRCPLVTVANSETLFTSSISSP